MDLLRPFRRRPVDLGPRDPLDQARTAAVAPVAATSGSDLRESATRVVNPAQDRARLYAGKIGFIGRTYQFEAHQASRCPWTVEVTEDGGVSWAELDITTGDPGADTADLKVDQSAQFAWDVMRAIQPERGSQSDLIKQSAYLDETLGELYVIDVTDNERVAFAIRDPKLCYPEKKNRPKGPWIVADVEGGSVGKGTARRVDYTRVYRHWNDDPNSPLMATSSLLQMVEDVDTYWGLRRHLQREIRSRLAMNRVFWTPTSAHAEKTMYGGVEVSKLSLQWAQAAAKAINDEADALVESFAPFLIHTPGNERPPQMMDVADFSSELLAHIKDARELVASSLPLSTSWVLDGPSSSENHWSDWLADSEDEEVVRSVLTRIGETFTKAIFRPALRAGQLVGAFTGYDPENVRISFNTSVLRRQLDNSENAKWALDHGLLKPEVGLEALHFSAADLADETERALLASIAQQFGWTGARQQVPNGFAGMLPSADGAVPNGGTPGAQIAALAGLLDDRYLLEP